MTVSFYLKGSERVLLLGMRRRFVSSGASCGFVAGVQETISRGPRRRLLPEQPRVAPLRVTRSAACRVSLFRFIMDISKLLNYWGETHASPKGTSFIQYDYTEPGSITACVTWLSGLYIAALPMAS